MINMILALLIGWVAAVKNDPWLMLLAVAIAATELGWTLWTRRRTRT